ncbi:MAG: hypothetical protein EAZ97_04780 [Bacteroidetes bacterium]|nr:MAG: hypothetical protein EAZ97_04780 [Bacteroidota bacterium]
MNWSEIKKQIQNDLGFNAEIIQSAWEVMDYGKLKDLRDALKLRYQTHDFNDFQVVRNRLAKESENYFKTLFELIGVKVQGELAVCLKQFFNEFFKGKVTTDLFFNDKDSKSPKEFPSFFRTELSGYGESFKTLYDLRNACTHEGGMNPEIIYPNSIRKSLTDNTLYAADIKHCLRAYFYFTARYKTKLLPELRKIKNQDFSEYLKKLKSKLRPSFDYIELRCTDSRKMENKNIKEAYFWRKDYNRLLLTGEAGTGKTTTLKNWVFQETTKIPVFVALGAIKWEEEKPIRKAIEQQLQIDDINDLLENGDLALYLDALDEFPKDHFEIIKSEIDTLINDTDCDIILSTRRDESRLFPKLHSIQLQTLNEDQQKTYINKIITDKTLQTKVLNDIKQYELPENNIFWFAIVIQITKELGSLPEDVPEIIKIYLERLLAREATKHNKKFSDYQYNFKLAMKLLSQFEFNKHKKEGLDLGFDYMLDWAIEMGLLEKQSTGTKFRNDIYLNHIAFEW